ncbi:MAG TPA: dipeptide epimerase [Candidatus Dormibacteraeota bacterium]|nr:dipeptide epimerase [Candidatus Dormibacteraeota bacterium]
MLGTFAARELELPLHHPFKIARGEESSARTVVLAMHLDGIAALGESAPIARYGESVASVLAFFATYAPTTTSPYRLEELLDPRIAPAARCALDLALHDWIGKATGRPLYELFGLDPERTPSTSFTIGIADPETTLQKVDEVRTHPILKVKLGIGSRDEQIATIEAIRARYTGTIRIDANEGWSVDEAIATLRELERFEIELCEQPIPAGDPSGLRAISESTRIPIVTDEDSRFAEDLPRLVGCVAGVNMKLVKCGGLRAGLAMIRTARALGLKVMLGCMVESAILATAAAHLSPLVDWADIDGPFLTANDPFVGITYRDGKIVLPSGAGLGVRERHPL